MPLSSGDKLGPYEILSAIGAGGMGEVYRAKDTKLGRQVAIKVLPGHLAANPSARERLRREASAALSRRRSGSSVKRKTPPGASTRLTSRKTLSTFMNWLSIWQAITNWMDPSRNGRLTASPATRMGARESRHRSIRSEEHTSEL